MQECEHSFEVSLDQWICLVLECARVYMNRMALVYWQICTALSQYNFAACRHHDVHVSQLVTV